MIDEINRMLSYLNLSEHPLSGALREIAVQKNIPKKKIIVKPGLAQPQVFCLVSGLLRGYAIDEKGGEITDCFAYRYGDVRLNLLPSAEKQADEYVETLEDTVLITFSWEKAKPLFLQDTVLTSFCFERMTDIYTEQTLHKQMLCHTTALERYNWFLRSYPGIIDRAPLRHIASFLNITPETLSRLQRARRKNQNEE